MTLLAIFEALVGANAIWETTQSFSKRLPGLLWKKRTLNG